jgi:EAL domain-containing protein (putative c-di-GMP-specific phosphodiesterase class I)
LEQALVSGRFRLDYEPIVEIGSARLFAEEALIRLLDGTKTVYPRDFIGYMEGAEGRELIARMDLAVFQTVIDSARTALRPVVCINISAKTLGHGDYTQEIAGRLKACNGACRRIVVEVTETAQIDDIDTASRFLGDLRKLGIRTAIDDFGAGNASWRYLKYLPVDFIKIDGQFVRDIAKNRSDWRLLRAMSNLANTLGKEVIAEWVETQESYGLLMATGIRYAQGHFVQSMRNAQHG